MARSGTSFCFFFVLVFMSLPCVAVVIPCFNEAATIAKVVSDFKRELPTARIVVLDNLSTDESAYLAQQEGAEVIFVPQQGKGRVARLVFERIEADVVVMVDGDDTYPASAVHALVHSVWVEQADMAIATRLEHFDTRKKGGSFRPLHLLGNRCIVGLFNVLFGVRLNDVLSGYRALGRRFMVSMPVLSRGFEIETELTVHGIIHDYCLKEVPVVYGVRPEGSYSKLSTWRDGWRIVRLIPWLFKEAFPFRVFGVVGLVLVLVALFLGHLVVQEFEVHQRVMGLARAMGVVGLVLLSSLSFGIGILLNVVNRRAREAHRLSVQAMLQAQYNRRGSHEKQPITVMPTLDGYYGA
jgi:glycosyltransferase involved in cell wall biosynthesis